MYSIKKKVKSKFNEENQPLIMNNPLRAAEHSKVPLWRKVGYGIGAMPYAMCNTVMGYYLTYFLLEVALLKPYQVLLIIFLGRGWDAVTDPMCGYLTTKTKTRIGQFKPWLLFSAVPCGIVYFLLWFVPPFDSQIGLCIYFLIIYLMMETMLTCVHVPYTSLTMHLSYNQKETDSVTMYRVIFELLGTLAGIIAYTISFAIFVGDSTNNCADGRANDYNKEKKENAFRYHAVAVAVIIIISLLITFFSVKEQKEITQKKSSLSIFSALKQTWSFRPYRDLFFVELFSWLSVQFAQGNFVFYARYTLKLGDYYPYVVAIILVVNTLWLPMWHIISKRIGKKTSFVLGVWILMPILISLLFIDYFNYLIWLVGVLVGAGISAVYLLPWSMLPDVIDAASLKSGVRREELYYSFFVFGNKFSAGATLAISTGLYQLFGYDQLSCIQPWTVPLLFKLLVSTPPVIFLLISLIFLHRYPINAAAREEIKAKLIKKRQLHQADDQSPIDSEGVSPTLTTSSLSYTNLDDDDDDVMVTASEDVTLKGRGPPITELKK